MAKISREKLIREAGSVRDDGSDVKGSRQLAALARLDWRTAEPLLKNYAEGAAPRTAAFALGLLYEHAAQNNQSAEANDIPRPALAHRQRSAGAWRSPRDGD